MDRKEQFLAEYVRQVLEPLVLPDYLRTQYAPVSCLKDGRREVYLVRDQAGCLAVLKVQPAGREDSLREEYRLLRMLHHPQLPRPLAYLEEGGREYLVREYVEGVSLDDYVSAHGPLPPARVREAAQSLCRVLDYLHSQDPPVICRDIKPQNVVLDPAGRCWLIDLGAARRYRPDQKGDTVFLGTEITAPPEQFGYQQTDQRSDIYGLGMLLRFLLSGSFDPLPRRPGLGGLRRLVGRCTAFDPKRRYPSARAVFRSLKYRGLRLAAGAAALCLCLGLLSAGFWQGARQAGTDSSLLEAALRQALQLEEGAPIPLDRLPEVEQLLVCGQVLPGTLQEHEELINTAHDHYAVETPHGDIGDGDLALLARCTNLRVLILDYQEISDLSPLAGLPLEYLSLAGNQISNLSPLEDCQSLRALDLGENPVPSADSLARLPALRELVLDATGVVSLDAFGGSGLRYLNTRGTWVTDYTPLERCPDLKRLITGSMPEGAADTLAGLTGLEELRLYSTSDVDAACFGEMQQLLELDLYGSTVSHPEALADLERLQKVNLGETGLKDLTFLPRMPAMLELDLRELPLEDLSPLLDCPWLTRLILSSRHQSLAESQLAQASFQVVYQ